MKKFLFAITLASLMSVSHAWEFDMAEVKCSDLEDEEQAAMMLFWLDGYVSAKEEDTTMSEAWLEELGGYLEEGCSEGNYKILDIIQAKYLDSE
jgi:hypothetical protein